MKIEVESETTKFTDAILPDSAISMLPLKKEALSDWSEETTDLAVFLFELYEGTGYGDLSCSYFEHTSSEFQMWAQVFYEAASEASPSPASVDKDIKIPNFLDNPSFGGLAKSSSAWDNAISNVLSEGSYFSLAHMLETRTDLSSSIHLAAHLYYRQAYQVLRGFIESVVLPMHFCEHPNKYLDWKNNDYHAPALRGKHGILSKLVKLEIIDERLENQVSELYGLLNGYIHGAESSMNNKGVATGSWAGFVFQIDEYERWTDVYSSCVAVCLKLLRLHHMQWEKAQPSSGTICNVCHSSELSESETENDSGLIKVKCMTCGFSSHRKRDATNRVIVTTIEYEGEA